MRVNIATNKIANIVTNMERECGLSARFEKRIKKRALTDNDHSQTTTFSQGSYTVSANVASIQILHRQKNSWVFVFGRLVKLKSGRGVGSFPGTRAYGILEFGMGELIRRWLLAGVAGRISRRVSSLGRKRKFHLNSGGQVGGAL